MAVRNDASESEAYCSETSLSKEGCHGMLS